MKCPNCDFDNTDSQKYCGECGTQLASSVAAKPSFTKTLETPLKEPSRGSLLADRYKIVEELGRGGMGVVFKAEDTKLKRTVALKFLSPELTREKEAKERFIFEAQAVSVLDHPHICTVYEIDETEGQMFIVMAYVEGQSLRKITNQGPLKLDKALDVATQIAEGLHAAHEKGIVHRDIKSANIMVTAKGQARIMDFGVAKLAGRTRFTKTGATMGTVAYMSPEQARGDRVDHRSDIWSLGVVLYEMVIGQHPFHGDHEQAIVYSILNEAPEPMTGLRTGVPMELERIVNKALAKNPAHRYQHVDDMLVDLRLLKDNITDFMRSSLSVKPAYMPPPSKQWMRILPWALTMVMALAAAFFMWQWLSPKTVSPDGVSRFTLGIPFSQHFINAVGPDVAIAPDGSCLVYIGEGEFGRQLWVRKMDQLDARPIPGTQAAYSPFFSPDSQWVGFFAGGKLKKVSLLGGPPLSISDAAGAYGGSWGEKGMIVYGTSNSGLYQVSSAGGTPQSITTPDKEKGVTAHYWPELLPGDEAVLCTLWRGSLEEVGIVVVDIETGEVRPLVDVGTCPRYAPTGHLLYGSPDGSLLAAPFSLDRLEVTGPVISLLDNIHITSGGPVNFSFSRSGTLVYITGEPLSLTLVMVDRQGFEQTLTKEERGYRSPRFSPDGRQVAVDVQDGSALDVWIFKMEEGPLTRLTFGEDDLYPAWTPGGERIVFSSSRLGTADFYWKEADGSSEAEILLEAEFEQYETCVSPDGKFLVYRETHPETGMNIHVLPLEGERVPQPFLVSSFRECTPTFSPDGRWLAYASSESGQSEVYVRTFPDVAGGRWQVSTGGGQEPVWARDGRELFYRSRDNKIVSVAIKTDPVFEVGTSQVLFEDVYVKRYQHTNYDIHPHEDRFVMIKSSAVISSDMTVVLNWFEELERLVPAKK